MTVLDASFRNPVGAQLPVTFTAPDGSFTDTDRPYDNSIHQREWCSYCGALRCGPNRR